MQDNGTGSNDEWSLNNTWTDHLPLIGCALLLCVLGRVGSGGRNTQNMQHIISCLEPTAFFFFFTYLQLSEPCFVYAGMLICFYGILPRFFSFFSMHRISRFGRKNFSSFPY
ncbi:uncharacterized protein BYT42DRAFT_562911 [Radiomyces spectabilis]|uniref:uncharacterized protein n=1 Tax=Radiomyces spectabilis TaxID=64574 RepID=UPI00221ED13D|nr:uncharacterized protein BYT42DRAFT_562911 [Radiomyces spectabilis]KAI8384564.1 hypothetical protein BYT42DRAFT_562911 [Radiomyces spectabilis]